LLWLKLLAQDRTLRDAHPTFYMPLVKPSFFWIIGVLLETTALAAEVQQDACLLQRSSRHGDKFLIENSQTTSNHNKSNHSVVAITDDPRVSLRLELHMTTGLKAIQEGKSGPLRAFLESLRTELASIANISPKRIDMLGLRGEYLELDKESLLNVRLLEVTRGNNSEDVLSTDTIVDMEVLPGWLLSDATPRTVFMTWQAELGNTTSKLMNGPLKGELQGAVLKVGSEQKGRIILKNLARTKLSCLAYIFRTSVLLLFWASI